MWSDHPQIHHNFTSHRNTESSSQRRNFSGNAQFKTHRECLQPEGVPQQLLEVGGPAAHAAHVDAALGRGRASAPARRRRVAPSTAGGGHGGGGAAAVDDVRDGDVVLKGKESGCLILFVISVSQKRETRQRRIGLDRTYMSQL